VENAGEFVGTADIGKAKAIYTATRHLKLSNVPPLDLLDRLSLLTVAAGLRRVGVLEGEGLQLTLVRDAVGNRGMLTSVSASVWSERKRVGNGDDDELLELCRSLRSPSQAPAPTPQVLWLYGSPHDRKEVKGRVLTKYEAGTLLGYPECCVHANVESGYAKVREEKKKTDLAPFRTLASQRPVRRISAQGNLRTADAGRADCPALLGLRYLRGQRNGNPIFGCVDSDTAPRPGEPR
jgi:hypothetical protein